MVPNDLENSLAGSAAQVSADPEPTWLARRTAAVPRGVSNLLPVFVERGENAELWDLSGRRYIDFAAGIAVVNTGHLHPKVTAAAHAQLDRISHACFQVTPYPSYVELAERLNALAPGPTPKKTLLLTTGAEAVENAVKIARAHTRRRGVVAFSGGFHGRTMMALALTGKVVPYKSGFGPFPGDVHHLPFPDERAGVEVADSLHALDNLLHADLDPSEIAAILIEPVQGEGGFHVAPPGFMRALREVCDQHGIVLIVDEIQTGFARTGRMFAVEHSDIEPDLMTLAKGLGGGLPISAVTGKAHIMDAPLPGGLGGTFAGSPVACAAALAVLDVIEEEGLCARADELGLQIRRHLEALRSESSLSPVIGDVRGVGAMVAMELVEEGDLRRPGVALTMALISTCAERGVVILPCGLYRNVVRFLAPLTISDALLHEGLGIVGDTLRDLVAVAA